MSAVVDSVFVARPRAALFFENYFSSIFFIALTYVFYTKFSTYHISIYDANWRPHLIVWESPLLLRASDLFRWLAFAYAVALVPFYAMQPAIRAKSAIFIGYILSIDSLQSIPKMTYPQKQAFLCLLLKFLFVPFVCNGLLAHASLLNNQLLAMHFGRVVDLVALAMNLIFVVDFLPFVIGYLFEGKWLRNEIVTVDPSLFGWVVCLLCYPPFNGAVGQFFPWGSRDHVEWSAVASPALYYGLNALIAALFVGYASASVSLGWKCSNLTNRGVVASGLYRYVRHPAYALKNLAWWIAALPAFYRVFSDSLALGWYAVFSLAGWSMLYVLRSIAEERHMLQANNGYAEYRQLVKWRFIPGVI